MLKEALQYILDGMRPETQDLCGRAYVITPSGAQEVIETPIVPATLQLHSLDSIVKMIRTEAIHLADANNGQSYSYQMKSWVKNRGMPIHTKRVNACSFRVVYLEEFWEWAEQHRSFIDFSKLEPLALGKEPDWVAEQRRKDYQSFALQRKDPWSPDEDNNLIRLLKQQKYGYAELSEILRRSEGAIVRRCRDLGLKERPVRADPHRKGGSWSDEQHQILADGIRHGDSYSMIGRVIGKSEKALRGKIYFTYLTEDADKVRAMLGDGPWGHGAPEPTVRQGFSLSKTRTEVRKNLSILDALLRKRMNDLGYCSATYAALPEVTGVDTLADPDSAVDAGKLFLIDDGRQVKLSRAVTSKTTLAEDDPDMLKKIKLVAALDLIRYYAITTVEDEYLGKCANTYDNKCILLVAFSDFFASLEAQNVIQEGSSGAELDADAIRTYLLGIAEEAGDTEEIARIKALTDEALRKEDTGSHVFLYLYGHVLDAMEDFHITLEAQ